MGWRCQTPILAGQLYHGAFADPTAADEQTIIPMIVARIRFVSAEQAMDAHACCAIGTSGLVAGRGTRFMIWISHAPDLSTSVSRTMIL